ncbi:MAG: hypothetical protein H6933_17065 [Burkholderiaceae bacterium]|nr:hypothetical protein [Burkholderiaceae bacterium]
MHDRLTTPEIHRLYDDAHARAEALRRAARDDFWRGTDALLGSAASHALRAAERLAQRLQRRQRGAEVSPAAATSAC